MKQICILGFILLFITTSFASAEEKSDLLAVYPGSKIKVVTKTEKENSRRNRLEYYYTEYKGHFLEKNDTAFIVRTEQSTVSIPRSSISELYTSNKTKMNFGKGFKYGGAVGVVGGAILGYAEGPFQMCIFGHCDPPTTSQRINAAIGFGIGFGIAFGLVGGVIGSFIRTDEWGGDRYRPLPDVIYPDVRRQSRSEAGAAVLVV